MPRKVSPKPGKPAVPAPVDTKVTVQVVLDRSGSMGAIRGSTIEGFNAFLTEQRRLPGARFGLTQFDHDGGHPCIDVVYVDVPIEQVASLTEATYQPRGGTPLYDAIGVTIAALERRVPAGKVVFVIVTDGEENQSREWTHQAIFDRIAGKRADGWEFVFMGANVDAYATSASMGIPANASRQFRANEASNLGAYASLAQATTSYRLGHTAAMVMAPEPEEEPTTWKRGAKKSS
jgi:hypothetical protein